MQRAFRRFRGDDLLTAAAEPHAIGFCDIQMEVKFAKIPAARLCINSKLRSTMDPEERRFHALDFLLDYSKGTLWWVSNKIWNAVIPGFVWKKGNESHPGLSIARRKASGLYSVVPMLIGTSKRRCGRARCLEVRNISPEGAAHHDAPTYFDALRPRMLRFNEFGRADAVSKNVYKPRLDIDEFTRLDGMLAGQGVWHG